MMLPHNNLTQQYEDVNSPAYSSRNTLATIKEFACRVDEKIITSTAHTQRVKRFSGLPDFGIPRVMLQDLYDAGFIWMVNTSFVNRFHYHAAVGPDIQWHDCRVFAKQGNLKRSIVYAGDIPDFALDRIEKVTKIGISNFTIHSMQPLPVKFVLTDPVLIGWPAMPFIEIINCGKPSQKLNFHIEDITGIVIAAWDTNHELEI